MKNHLLSILFLVCFGTSCQNKSTTIMQNPEITEKNIVNKLTSNIQHYHYEPMYYLTYEQNVCYSEILVNDIPIKFFLRK